MRRFQSITLAAGTLAAGTLAAGLALALASTAALAQGEGAAMKPNTVMFVSAEGSMVTVPIADKTLMQSVIRDGRMVTASQIFMMSDGKMYTIDDRKMPDGRMMSEHMRAKP